MTKTTPQFNLKKTDTLIRIGEVMFSYVYAFAPRIGDDGKPGKYGVCVVWSKDNEQTTKLVQEAINAAKEQAKAKGIKLPANCKTPIRDGDLDRPDDENFAGCWFMNCNCGQKPGVRVRENGMISEALDESDFYSGCYGAAVINIYPYDSNGNKGIGAGLNNVLKTRDGTKLSGGTNADSDFADLGDLNCLD